LLGERHASIHHGLPYPGGFCANIRMENGVHYNLQRQRAHRLVYVEMLVITPRNQHLLSFSHHADRVRADSLAVKSRLRQPALPPPKVAFAEKDAVAEGGHQHFVERWRLDEPIGLPDEHFVNQAGIVEQEDRPVQRARQGDKIAILTRHACHEGKRVALELGGNA
jgi:hypothetical protein